MEEKENAKMGALYLFWKTGRIELGIRHTNRNEIIGKRPVWVWEKNDEF